MTAEARSGLCIVGRYGYPHEAHIARAQLEAEGIPAYLLDEHQVQMRWDLALALGGVKLAVGRDDAARARALLEVGGTPALDAMAEPEPAPRRAERCARCGEKAVVASRTARPPGARQWLVAACFLALGLLVPRRRAAVHLACPACGHGWSITEIR